MYNNLNFYIDLDWEDYIAHENEYLKNLNSIIELIHQHRSQVFFCNDQIDSIKELFSEYHEDFNTSLADSLEIILQNAITLSNNKFMFEVSYSLENSSLNYIPSKIIASMQFSDKLALVSFTEKHGDKSLLAIESGTNFGNIKFSVCNNIQELLAWILLNIPERNFNLSDKHGENGIGNWDNASPLLCSEEKAQEMLNKAIPDFTDRTRQLFFFDDDYNTFIEFYYEGDIPQNLWHGFHLDISEWNRVPNKVLKYFNKRL